MARDRRRGGTVAVPYLFLPGRCCALQLSAFAHSARRQMRRPRRRQSSDSSDWLSPLLVVSKGLVSVGNCVPFPYVNAALSSGVALLELIQASALPTANIIDRFILCLDGRELQRRS
jgi:hypothetical protein